MTAKNYRIKIVANGNEFEAEGDKAFVLDMVKKYSPNATAENQEKHHQNAKVSSSKAQAIIPEKLDISKAISIREFIQRLQIKKHTDITVAFGYYLEKHSGLNQFSAADLNKCYYDAKMENSNTNQMIVQNIKRGYMMEAKRNKDEKGSKRYVLTDSGEKYIETKMLPSS